MDEIIYNVLKKIEDNGFEAYIVGGFVRDFLLKKESKDVDICTNARVKDLVDIFNSSNITLFDYGNVLLDYSDYQFEITTYRKDIKYVDNRRPEEIEYVDSLGEDLLRRDFTINSICMNKDGKIIDLIGGKNDLKKRIIKSIGNPDNKFNDDALRMLRAIRFATILNFKLDEDVKKSILKNKHLLNNLSYERKMEELNKIFSSKNKKYAVRLIKELDLEDDLEIKNIDSILLTNHIMGMWAMITDIDYSFTKMQKKIIKEIKELYNIKNIDNYTLYKYGFYSVGIVCDLRKINKDKMFKRYEGLPIHDREEIDIDSKEICDLLGKNPDSFLKDIYIDLENKILAHELMNKKDRIIDYIKNNYVKL